MGSLEFYEYFYMGICRSAYHSFNLVNLRFLVKLYFSLLNSTGRFTFVESLLQNFLVCFFTLTYVPLDE